MFYLIECENTKPNLDHRFCPMFLMPNVNVLKDLKACDSRRISADIAMLQNRILSDPSQVLTYIGYQQHSSIN